MKPVGVLPPLQKQTGTGYTKFRNMYKKMNNRRATRRRITKQRAGSYQTSQQFFDSAALPPTAFFPAPSTAPTPSEIRQGLYSTFTGGGRKSRRTGRRTHGGFSPSIMGPFVANAQAALVPLALYALYHQFVPKKSNGGRSTRKATRK